MNSPLIARTLLNAFCALAVPAAAYAQYGSLGLLGDKAGVAVDTKGVFHTAAEYRGKQPPWLTDRVRAVAPDYPLADRARHHQGTGVFRLTLDLKTGTVSTVTTLKTTGFSTLDSAAAAAFRRWRWKPGKWKDIVMPVTFEMASGPRSPLSPGTSRLPPP